MSYFDDFFDEPSEFEQQIAEFKESLVEAVKAEYKEKMQALEEENAELREFKEAKEEHERILRNKVAEYDRRIQQAKSEVRRASLKSIFGENLVSAYRAHGESAKYKKCDRCNENRRIPYKTPLGNDAYEECPCNRSVWWYTPKEVKLTSFYAHSDSISSNRRTSLYYERVDSDRHYDRYDMCGEIYNGEEFEKVNSYRAVFFDREKCAEYCEWLNKKQLENSASFMSEWGLTMEESV